MRRRSRIGRGLVPAILVLLGFGPGAGAGPDPFNTYRILGDAGAIFEWSPGGTRLRPAASPLGSADLAGAVKDLASFAGGTRLVVLAPNRDDPGKGRRRREGVAIVYDTGRPIPAVMHRIPLEGDGYGVATAPDGRLCYVLAARLDGARGPRFWIHALDPEVGELTSSTLIERPATGLTVAPDGSRLFASFENRIQTYTTGPLVTSWHYRSPGLNGPLYFPPAGDVLYAIRTGGIALFDPVVILNRDRNVPRDESDDATGSIPLPFGASFMLFSEQRPRAAAVGRGTLAFIDLSTGKALPAAGAPAPLRTADLLRPLEFLPGGELVVGMFPAAVTTEIAPPELPPMPGAVTAAGESTPEVTDGAALEEPVAGEPPPVEVAPVVSGPPPTAEPQPAVGDAPPTTVIPADGVYLAGRLSGDLDQVAELVLYGPGSIIREYARVAPDGEGRFRFPLPPPGTYRLMPVGAGSRPVPSTPNFHTVLVETGAGHPAFDFSIEGGS